MRGTKTKSVRQKPVCVLFLFQYFSREIGTVFKLFLFSREKYSRITEVKLAKVYEPQQYEPTTYALWEASGAFAPVKDAGQSKYSIVMPPPNANGDLHIGHALMIVLEDIMIRYHRMKGESTIWIPGADHAGFETWVVFEKNLEKEGKTRFDYGRDELYKMTWDFVAAQRGNMELQLRELGASCDWSKLTFTLDEKVIATAYKTFQKMWTDGLIYRGERIVNYCTFHGTSFADIEVQYKDEASKLWQIAYPLSNGEGEIIVATTRPETMLGDTAVAVHPDDERYRDLVGKKVKLPLIDREIPIVADDAIEREFGTGAVKVTPAHDPTDFEIGERHNLKRIHIIGFDGRMSDEAPEAYRGLKAAEARQKVVAELQEAGALRGEEDYTHSVGHCYKCGTVIEPLCKEQWFVDIAPLAKRAIAALKKKEITFYPDNKRQVLINYLEGLKDWNISRQIPWGIPIPAFQNTADPSDWIFDTRVEVETIEKDGKTYRRDPDTFDTWFSSGQWPFITTDYLEKGELADFYPLSVMETGFDILFPWVSRMIMLGLYCTDKVPFKEVYLHGLVLDEHGLKMSKSKGNVINPQGAIREYGSDALRMGIIANRSAGMSQAFSPASVVAGRNFANKLWNIARFTEDLVGDEYKNRTAVARSLADHWVLQRLQQGEREISSLIEQHRFAEAYEVMYHLTWDDVADWFIEANKVSLNKPLLAFVLETILKLAHPFAPFVTETIWQTLAWEEGLLMSAAWPTSNQTFDAEKAAQFTSLQQLITEVRYLQNELKVSGLELQHKDVTLLETQKPLLDKLARINVTASDSPRGLHIAHPTLATWLSVDEETLAAHRKHLEDRIIHVRAFIVQLEGRLNQPTYVKHAPAPVVQQTRDQLAEQQALRDRLQEELKLYS